MNICENTLILTRLDWSVRIDILGSCKFA